MVAYLTLFLLSIENITAGMPRPRTLEEKIREADLIVLGKATAFGKERIVDMSRSLVDCERNLRVEVREILWPPAFTNSNEIVFRYRYLKTLPEPTWNYTNTAGIFFLVRNKNPNRGRWDRPGSGDWMEMPTNALTIVLSIQKQKGQPFSKGRLQVPGVPYPRTTPYEDKAPIRWAYLTSFRDGYFEAFSGKHRVLLHGPTTDEEKAKVIGFADGQLAGDAARLEWIRELDL